MILTPNTVLKKAKTLFGTNIIEIKSEYDTLTICAYTSVEDTAWYSELYHALERVKKTHRDECSNGKFVLWLLLLLCLEDCGVKMWLFLSVDMPFPEVVWRQQDPSCVAISSDIIDLSSFDESYHRCDDLSTAAAGRRVTKEPTASSGLQYAVLCRVHTGLSSLHSVQIGPFEHLSIRLEVSCHSVFDGLALFIKMNCMNA